jgi:hypothetical protein
MRITTAGLCHIVSCLICAALASSAAATQIGPLAFQNPLQFDFSDLAQGTHLGANLPNPYTNVGVQFTGYVANATLGDIQGNHLATGFANTPAEPFVVRIELLSQPAFRVGAYVWPEYGSSTSMTAFDDRGAVLDSLTVTLNSGTTFMGLETSPTSPIRRVEWRGLVGSSKTTYPRVDGVMVQSLPEPSAFSLLAAGVVLPLVCAWRRRRGRGFLSNNGIAH